MKLKWWLLNHLEKWDSIKIINGSIELESRERIERLVLISVFSFLKLNFCTTVLMHKIAAKCSAYTEHIAIIEILMTKSI